MKALFVLLSIIFVSQATQIIPVPLVAESTVLTGDPATADVHIIAHYDLLCPDCRDSWSYLSSAIEIIANQTYNYTNVSNLSVCVSIHYFPWPFHTWSFETSVIAKFIQTEYPYLAPLYVQSVFANQSFFTDPNISLGNFAGYMCEFLDEFLFGTIPCYQVYDALVNYNHLARISLKIGNQKAVSQTPTYFVNDVRLDDAGSYGPYDWVNFLEQFRTNGTNTTSSSENRRSERNFLDI